MNLENNDEVRKRKDFFINLYYTKIKEAYYNIESGITKNVSLLLVYSDGRRKIEKQNIELIAKLHTIEIICTENLNYEGEYQAARNLILSKKLELLELLCEEGILFVEDHTTIIEFTVTFEYRFSFVLSGENVSTLNKSISFLSAITKLKRIHNTTERQIFGFYISDAFRLYIQALYNCHPGLGIWRTLEHIFLPIKEEGWLKSSTLFSKNRTLRFLNGVRLREYLVKKQMKEERKIKRKLKEGNSFDEIKPDKDFIE